MSFQDLGMVGQALDFRTHIQDSLNIKVESTCWVSLFKYGEVLRIELMQVQILFLFLHTNTLFTIYT